MSDSKKMIDKKIAGMIMALLVIAVLFVPAYASYEIEQRTVTHILEVEGLYENGTVFNAYEPVDQTHIEAFFTGEIKTGTHANNDSIYIKFQGVNYMEYTNFVSYIGNGTYAVTPNYTIHGLPYIYRQILIPLNITTHELAEFDFIRLNTNSEHGWHEFLFRTTGGNQWVYLDKTRNDTYLTINTVGAKSQLLLSPDEPIYLSFSGLDQSDVTFNFKMQGFNLDEEHQFFWTSEHLYFGSVAVAFVVLLVCAVFTTNFVDIKFDKVKDGRRKRG